MTRIFLTGATGYLGGQALCCLKQSSTKGIEIKCLVRDTAKAQKVNDAYPDVNTVQGNLDDSEITGRESKDADIVLSLFRSQWL